MNDQFTGKAKNGGGASHSMPDRMTPEERDKLISDLALKLRMSTDRPPGSSGNGRGWRFNGEVSLAVVLQVIIFAGVMLGAYGTYVAGQERISNRLDALEAGFKARTATMEAGFKERTDNIVADIGSRRQVVNSKLDEQERRTQDVPLLRENMGALKGSLDALIQRIDRGQGERVQNDKDLTRELNGVKTEQALLRQEMQRLSEAARRGDAPFRENRIESPPRIPFSLRASLDAGLRENSE